MTGVAPDAPEDRAAPDRATLSRALLSRLADQCSAIEAAIATGHEQARALRELRIGPMGTGAFDEAVARMAERRDALAQALANLVEAAETLAGGPLESLRAAAPFLEPAFLRAWEGGLARLTALNAALAEQQATAEIHARRGLTVLDAWRNLLGAPADAGPTYNRYGQTRGNQPEPPSRLDIKL